MGFMFFSQKIRFYCIRTKRNTTFSPKLFSCRLLLSKQNEQCYLKKARNESEKGLLKGLLGVTIQLLGLKNSDTAPTASLAPPSYAPHPDRSSSRSLSLYRSCQHFLPGRRMLLSKLNEQR